MWSIKWGRFWIRWDFWLLPLVMTLTAPPVVLLAVFSAAALHEAGHLLLLRRFGLRCRRLYLTLFGAEIDAPQLLSLSYGRELCVTLAGPAVNIAAAFALGAWGAQLSSDTVYLFAGAQFLLGLFNLLPVQPLDGGRALYLVCAWTFGPFIADAICAPVCAAAAGGVLLLSVRLSLVHGGGALFPLAAGAVFLAAVRQLGLAKGALRV